jgi:hypothetical protein
MRWFTENEREFRHIEKDLKLNFLNWKDEKEQNGTASLIVRARKTCNKMEIKMNLNGEEMIMKIEKSEFQTKTVIGVGRFLTQKIIRVDKIEKLIGHEVHGVSFTMFKKNEVSNSMLTNIYMRRSDAFFCFIVVRRTYCLPTLMNLQGRFGYRR